MKLRLNKKCYVKFISSKNKNHSTLVELCDLNICHFRTTLTFLDQGHKAELALLQGNFVRPLGSVLKGGFFLRTPNKRPKNVHKWLSM